MMNLDTLSLKPSLEISNSNSWIWQVRGEIISLSFAIVPKLKLFVHSKTSHKMPSNSKCHQNPEIIHFG